MRRSIGVAVLTILLLAGVVPTGPAGAGVNIWTGNGPNGGDVRALAIDPATPATVYAGGSGVLKSLNGGASWNPVNFGLGEPGVRAIVIDRTAPGTLYAGTTFGVFRSTNGGASWSPASTGLTPVNVCALAIDPTTPTTLYAGTAECSAAGALSGGTVFKTTDGGASWTPSGPGLPGIPVQALAVDPSTPTTIYAGHGCRRRCPRGRRLQEH